MNIRDFWYIAAESRELKPGKALARQILDEWLVIFRGPDGAPTALRDRCMHRAYRLSQGSAENGCIRCPYHGWLYDAAGQVVEVPAEGPDARTVQSRKTVCYDATERDGYVYVRLNNAPEREVEPFPMPHYRDRGWGHVRLQNRFSNNVTNCVENFIDIPHTVFVHPGIFRKRRGERIEATVQREHGVVTARYAGETDNLGWFSWFLNPGRHRIVHTDQFFMPNITHVRYEFGPRRVFLITSQSVPVSANQTLVYTDLTYDYGIFTPFAGPIVRWQGQAVIDQDLMALKTQMAVIEKYGDKFANTPADLIHVLVESIQTEIAEGRDPRDLPPKSHQMAFYA